MTDIKTLNARRKLLEADQEKQPERDFTPEWTELAKLYMVIMKHGRNDWICSERIRS